MHLADVIVKHYEDQAHITQVAFLKFFFAALLLLIFGLLHKKKPNRRFIKNPLPLLCSSLSLSIGTLFWFFGVRICTINAVTVIAFTIPLFTLIASYLIIRQPICTTTVFANLIGFCGVLIVVGFSGTSAHTLGACALFVAAILFSVYAVITEKIAETESLFAILFVTSVLSALLLSPLAIQHWQPLEISELIPYAGLGIISNTSIFALIMAYRYENAAFLAPFIYSEMILSISSGYFLFNEHVTVNVLLGLIFIGGSNLLILRTQWKKVQDNKR